MCVSLGFGPMVGAGPGGFSEELALECGPATDWCELRSRRALGRQQYVLALWTRRRRQAS